MAEHLRQTNSACQGSLVDAEQILETMAEGVIVLDTKGYIRQWNRAMTELTGYNAREAVGQHVSWLEVPGCTTSERIAGLLSKTEDGARPDPEHSCLWGCQCELKGKDESRIPVLLNARVLYDRGGGAVGLLNTVTDFRPVHRLQQEVAHLRGLDNPPESYQGLIGQDPKMLEVYRLIDLAAASDATVLILGESGTGKELVAAAVHHLSHRRDQPFVKVNCGALTETILESELFGHVKGAFTGAYQDRVGRFEAADNGTAFLDEIGEISPAVQIKLLRFLQENEFERVGDSRTRK
ncbi:MAG: sigma 54-interacting transcriptional regulator, partial [Candidatus Pacebacteria bacterium]|nr:sigma 54-interacting transcriptional regulator [Candidatus Paceibacterota bacterium]